MHNKSNICLNQFALWFE